MKTMKFGRTALVLALAMTIILSVTGGTIAWFTDEVTSANNVIEAGNLDMYVEYKTLDMTNWDELKADTQLFNSTKWEPGHTEYASFKITNNGSLAFKYDLNAIVTNEVSGTNVEGKSFNLSDYLMTGCVEGTVADRVAAVAAAKVAGLNGLNTSAADVKVLLPTESVTATLVITMPTTVGNEANHDGEHIPSIDFGVRVVATQAVSESDSFGNTYDEGAQYPRIKVDIESAEDFAKVKEGNLINITQDITLTEEVMLPANTVLRGNGCQINGSIYAGGDLTIEGRVKVTSFSASYYNRVITIGEGACLEITGTGRMTIGYGNTFNITGTVKNAKTADKSTIQPSLIIPGGISITGGNDATMNVKNAYVQIGSTTSKNSAANGTFNLNFTNAIAEFTNQLMLAEPTNGMNPKFKINVKDSVLTTGTKFIVAAPNSDVVIDNSNVTLASYFRNSGKVTLKNGAELTGSTIQFGENGGNNGTTIVDNSTFTITASSTGNALDGKGTGKLELKNGATANVDFYKGIAIVADTSSVFNGTEVK